MKMEIKMIPIEKISPSTFQPRETFDKESIRELAESIKEYGLLQPIIVRPVKNGNYQIVAGERRWRAFQFAGFKEIPAIVKDIDTTRQLIESLIENVQREDLKPIEKGRAVYQIYMAHGIEIPPKELAKTIKSITDYLRTDSKRRTRDLNPGEQQIYEVAKKVPLSLDYQRILLEGLAVSSEIQKIEIEKSKDETIAARTLARLSTIEDKELQKKVYEKIIKEGMNHVEASKFITTVKKVSEPVRQAMLKPESRITPEVAETIEKELYDEYEKAKMIEMVERHGLGAEEVKVWMEDMKRRGVRAFEPRLVHAEGMELQVLKRISQLDNATNNLESFYTENKEDFTYNDLKKLHSGLNDVLERLLPIHEEVGKLIGVKLRYVREIEVR